MSTRPHRLIRIGDAVSQFLNALLLDGDANESISGRSHREGWARAEWFINWLLSWLEDDHCRRAHEADVARAKEWATRFTLTGDS